MIECDLVAGCTDESCLDMAEDEFVLLRKPTYSHGASIRRLVGTDAEEPFAEHRTARKRALRAKRKGYLVVTFEPRDRYADMLSINRSSPVRQGRAMDDSYVNLTPTTGLIGPPKCHAHNVTMYGVATPEHLRIVAYGCIYRCGDLVHVSQWLGHADFLDDGIMFLLAEWIMREQTAKGGRLFFYNRHDSGTEGLRWYKERIGLQEGDVRWTLGK
jgi:hypothetical protein